MSVQRQISEAEKQAVIERQGLRCFIDNHPVDSEADLVFDHIEPYSQGGATDVGNIGAVCAKHNREKGPSPSASSATSSRCAASSRAHPRDAWMTSSGSGLVATDSPGASRTTR